MENCVVEEGGQNADDGDYNKALFKTLLRILFRSLKTVWIWASKKGNLGEAGAGLAILFRCCEHRVEVGVGIHFINKDIFLNFLFTNYFH